MMFHGQGILQQSSGLYSQIIENQNLANSLVENIMDGIRRQTEKLDFFEGFVQLHSPSGGAGSGLSKLLTMHLTDNYRK